jgi:hypothetical protein
MRHLNWAWQEIKASFREKPGSWVLFALLCVATYLWHTESSKLDDVCGMAREAIGITTPTPDHPDAVLKQAEMPSAVNSYSIRELWRWQQLDGPQIEDLCP